MKAANLWTRPALLLLALALGLSMSEPGHALSQPGGNAPSEDSSASFAYYPTSGPTILGAGHISGSFLGRWPCCSLPGRVAYDKIVFPTTISLPCS
jgi:hypothetical protein